ncbi:hypothetical protein MYCTH_2295239 [Thermothelomyces thermophilus ATCC 42464]|uniref:Uncharacterized protein n=1 Tax=Thermothelomyces thermophilus (strain ATCC 42464 / BCRC 31852 / DSM 1799) TaxID=573729 RepID=G2Q432_THET4|nr:uncharacterized protein MYCTH_2295239 [Thermothelomyces thermophilus ATCC 42464]AEO53631.1 hypothetical protein MYCTH_2295239 [Thermothelomyces thermophilus ATCC 42464]
MLTSRLVLPAAWLMLLGSASAAPAPESAAAGTDATTSVTDAAPPPPPVPTNEDGSDAFVTCSNTDGPFKPFCLPKHNDVYYPGSTHYVTWDTSFFPSQNTTLRIVGIYANLPPAVVPEPAPAPDSDEEASSDPELPPSSETAPHGPHGQVVEAFSSDTISAAWGFYQWHLDQSLLKSHGLKEANITLRIAALAPDSRSAQWYSGPTITLQNKPKKRKKPVHTPTPADDEVLYIALPLIFGFATFMIVGTFCWNRQLRRIGVGNVMGRANTRGRRLGASRRDRAKNRDKESSIRLMESGGAAADSDEEGWSHGSSSAAERRVFERVDRKRD